MMPKQKKESFEVAAARRELAKAELKLREAKANLARIEKEAKAEK